MEKEYNKELRLTVVKENEAGVSHKSLAKKYGVARSTIQNWCYLYQMYGEAGIENSLSKTKYSGEFKLSVLNYRDIHQVFYREAAEHFGIKQGSTIANWQRAYDSQGFEGLTGAPGRPKRKLSVRYLKAIDIMQTNSIAESATITGISVATLKRIRKQYKDEVSRGDRKAEFQIY